MLEPQELHTAIAYAIGRCPGYKDWNVVTQVEDNACLTVHITPKEVSVSKHGTHIDTAAVMAPGTKDNNLDSNSSVPAGLPRQYCLQDLLNPQATC